MLDNQQCIFSGNLDFKHKGIVGGKAPIWNRIRFRLGLFNDKMPYSKDEQDKLEDMMLSGAMLSIDTLMGKKADNPVIVPQPSKIPLGA